MTIFHDDIDSLHKLTMSLDCYPTLFSCAGCSKGDQFVSHGFLYKIFRNEQKRTTGKRICCNNRRGGSGCGKTLSLYLTVEQPKFVYNTTHITIFFTRLLLNSSIPQAYQIATQCYEPRNAYRWINKAYRKLIEYRSLLEFKNAKTNSSFNVRSVSRKILLSTVNSLFIQFKLSPCQNYQLKFQHAFL